MQNILFAHGFILENDRKQFKEKFRPYPPLATLYAAAVVREAGFSVFLYDPLLPGFDRENFSRSVAACAADVLIVYEDSFNYLSKMCLDHVRQTTAQMISSVSVPVVVNSSDASYNPGVYLAMGADCVVIGEGEPLLVDVLRWLGDGAPEDAIPQGAACRHDEEIRFGDPAAGLCDLSSLPLPAWDLVDFRLYRAAWKKRHGFFSINMVCSRGCPFSCNWCSKPIWGNKYVVHPPAHIVAQLDILNEMAGPDHVWFTDDIFGLDQQWLDELSDLLAERQDRVPFTIQSRVDIMSEHSVAALRKAGCCEVWLGVESGAQKILDRMGKGTTVDQIRTASQLLRRHGISPCFFIQLGYPGEDIAELCQTRALIMELMPDTIGVSVSYPLPRTAFYEEVKTQFSDKTHWEQSDDLAPLFRATFASSVYLDIKQHLQRELLSVRCGGGDADWDSEWKKLLEKADGCRNPCL